MHLFFTIATITALTSVPVAAVSGSCKCGSNLYTQDDIINAFVADSTAVTKKTTIKGFPKVFTNKPDNIKFDPATGCLTGPFGQFPLHKKTPFTAKDAEGPDSMVYDARNHHFCGCITQTGAVDSTSKKCTY